MTGYRIPWRKIEDGCAWPDEEEIVLVSTEKGTTGDWLQKGRWHWASIYGDTVFAWAPLPAPYDPDAEPVDEIAALKARCERLVKAVRAHREVSYAKADAHLLAHEEARFVESHWKVDDARYQLRDAMDAVDEHGDLEVSE